MADTRCVNCFKYMEKCINPLRFENKGVCDKYQDHKGPAQHGCPHCHNEWTCKWHEDYVCDFPYWAPCPKCFDDNPRECPTCNGTGQVPKKTYELMKRRKFTLPDNFFEADYDMEE